MPTLTLFSAVSDASGAAVPGQIALTGGSRKSISEAISGLQTATVALTIDVSALKLIIVTSTVSMAVDFNGPSASWNLVAGVPYVWFTGSNLANPFGSTDVTSLTVENNEATSGTITIEVLTDPTP